MSGPDHDAEFEAFLKRRSPIHRRLADFDHAEPSADLDRLVLGRARKAIDTPAQPPFRTARWAMPLGLAASILIAFTVVLNIDHHARRAEKPVAATKAATPVAPAAQLTANRAVAAEAPPAVAEARESEEPAPDSGAARQDSRHQKTSELPLVASTRSGYVAPPLASGPAITSISDRASSGTSKRVDANAAPAAAAASLPPSEYRGSAEAWLREINRLRAAGKAADADRELTAFRQAYPSHPGYSLARPPTR